ncbi:hypothetical protein [Burkholderia gladioli]|uniref:hypothetical protein n=1 Tax=Burkholderia gladioli TaxID=28095 RepID=UPI00163ED296|nr:hypothetical protein [Burkholderia gladioli]
MDDRNGMHPRATTDADTQDGKPRRAAVSVVGWAGAGTRRPAPDHGDRRGSSWITVLRDIGMKRRAISNPPFVSASIRAC